MILAALCFALLVAAAIKREPPDFSQLPVVAVLRDGQQRPAWAIRVSQPAHEIAADSLRPEPPPAGHVYQLWLGASDGGEPQQLGLLPGSGRRQIAVTPAAARRFAGGGRLIVTLEPAGGSPAAGPTGPEVFHTTFGGSR